MTREQWQTILIFAVCRAAPKGGGGACAPCHPEGSRAQGRCRARRAAGGDQRLCELAQTLADMDTAREALIAHGYGADGDGLMDCVAIVIETKHERLTTDGSKNQ